MKNLFKNFISNIINRFLWLAEDTQMLDSQSQAHSQTQSQNNKSSTSNFYFENDKNKQTVITASIMIQNAHKHINAGKYDEAIDYINNAIKLCPNDRDYRLLLESTQKKIKERDLELARKEEKKCECNNENIRQNKSVDKKTQQTQSIEEKIHQYLENAKNYLKNEDFKNAKTSIQMARTLDKKQLFKHNIWDVEYSIEEAENKYTADKLLTNAEIKIQSGRYKEAVALAKKAMDLMPKEQYYINYFKKVYSAFEEQKRRERKKEQQTKEQYAKQAEIHYKNAEEYNIKKQYKSALEEVEKSIYFARQADIVSNKFVILKNKILSDKTTASNVKNNYNSINVNNTTSFKTKIKPEINHYEGYGILDGECDEYIPPNIAEIIANKSAHKLSDNNGETSKENITDKKSSQKNLEKNEPDNLIRIAESFINMGTYQNAYYYIEKAKKIVNENEDKKYIEKLELLSEKITLATFNPGLTKMIQQNDYESAIKQLKSFIENKPNNKLFYEKLKEVETLYDSYKEFEKSYNKAVSLYENEDYKAALTTINKVLQLNKNQALSMDNFEKLKIKVESEIIYQDMLKIYESENIDYELIIKKLKYVISKKYSDERYIYFLKKAVSEYELIQEKNYYNAANECYQDKNYKEALTNIDKVLKINSKSKEYKALKNKINTALEEIKINNKFDKYYQESIKAYNNAQFNEAYISINNALKLKPEDKDCKKLLEKIDSEKIDISTCTKQALMTLEFINQETADSIIQARNNGIMWYEYQKFAQQFEIMPHLWADVEEKIEFPLKQANKYGRRLDI